jgi:hypothetical protein
MPFDRQAIYDRQLQHLVRLASIEIQQCKAYAWHRAKELAADESGLWAGMDAALRAAMTGLDEVPGCAAQKSTRHH